MITTSSVEVEQYCAAVRVALAGVSDEVTEDLLEDLPHHLAEVLAEGEGSLRDRLGEPAAYAEELRAAAGLEPAGADSSAIGTRARMAEAAGRAVDRAGRVDVRVGRLVGYERFSDLARAVRPGWWVLRGWIVAQFLCGARTGGGTWHGLVPRLNGSRLVGTAVAFAVIAASVWLGRRGLRFSAWPRRALLAASVVIALAGVALYSSSGSSSFSYIAPASAALLPSSDFDCVYDKAGNLVDGARFFDQNGNQLFYLPEPNCTSGSTSIVVNGGPGAVGDPESPGAAPTPTYPVCASDPGPFCSGPGPISPTSASSTSPQSSTAPPSSPATAPKATASPTR